jgi:hypothetical protein
MLNCPTIIAKTGVPREEKSDPGPFTYFFYFLVNSFLLCTVASGNYESIYIPTHISSRKAIEVFLSFQTLSFSPFYVFSSTLPKILIYLFVCPRLSK